MTAAVGPYYRERNLVHTIDGMAAMDEVTQQIRNALEGDAANGTA